MDFTDHHFRVDLAEKYGVDIAIFLHDIYYWVRHNRNNRKNFHDGRYWTYNTMASFCEMHPYWSRRQIERIIAKCKEAGLLLVGCFNQSTWDRTSWYSLSDEAMQFFCDDITQAADAGGDPPADDMPEQDIPKMAESISPNGEMDITERGNRFHQTVTPIPDNIPNNKPDNKSPPKAPQGWRRTSEYELAEDAKPLLRAYCGEDGELARALADLIEIRQAKKAINSAKAISLLLNKLNELSMGSREMKLALIRQSIENSWKSVFPLKGGGKGAAPSAPTIVSREEVPTW